MTDVIVGPNDIDAGAAGDVNLDAGRFFPGVDRYRHKKATVHSLPLNVWKGKKAGGGDAGQDSDALRVSECVHGIVQRRWLLSRASSRMRMTFSACCGLTASSARPSIASRTLA